MDIQVAACCASAVGPLVEGSTPVLPDPAGVLPYAACRVVHTAVGGWAAVRADRQQTRAHERPGRWASRMVERLQADLQACPVERSDIDLVGSGEHTAELQSLT